MVEEKKDVRQILLSSLAILILIIAVIGISYAVWSQTFKGQKENTITTGKISFSYTESETNNIKIENALPISDEQGKKLNGNTEVFDFTVSNDSTVNVKYDVIVTPYKNDMDDKYIKVYLTDQNDVALKPYDSEVPAYNTLNDDKEEKNSKILYSSELTNVKKNEKLRLRVWVSDKFDNKNTPTQSYIFAFKVNVRARM